MARRTLPFTTHSAMTPDPGEARATKKIQETLIQLRALVAAAEAAESLARGQTAPDESLHFLKLPNRNLIGLGDQTVYFRTSTDVDQMDEAVIRCEILQDSAGLYIASNGDPLLVHSLASNALMIYAADPRKLRQ